MKILIPIITLVFGLLIGSNLLTSKEVLLVEDDDDRKVLLNKNQVLEKKYQSLLGAMKGISDIDLEEYIHLKKSEEKYKKADEILGKIMLLFLANIQLKLKPEVKDYFTKGERSSVHEVIDSKTVEEINPKQIDSIQNNITQMIVPLIIENPEFEQVAKNVEKTLIKNPYLYYKKAKAVEDLSKLKFLKGKFEGEVYLTKGKHKGSTEKIILDINFYHEAGKIKGEYLSQLFRDGQAYSTNRGEGGNTQIREVEHNFSQVLIETSPNSFIHLEIINGQDFYVGKYYDDDEFVGLVKLYRLN